MYDSCLVKSIEVPESVIAKRILFEHSKLEIHLPEETETLSQKMDRISPPPSSVSLPAKRKYYWSEEEAKEIRKAFAKFMEGELRPKKQDVRIAWAGCKGKRTR